MPSKTPQACSTHANHTCMPLGVKVLSILHILLLEL